MTAEIPLRDEVQNLRDNLSRNGISPEHIEQIISLSLSLCEFNWGTKRIEGMVSPDAVVETYQDCNGDMELVEVVFTEAGLVVEDLRRRRNLDYLSARHLDSALFHAFEDLKPGF